MDVFMTVIIWIVGICAGCILLLSIGFSAGAAAQTGKSEFGIIATTSSLLLIYLIVKGVSSLVFSSEVELADRNSSTREVQVEKPGVAAVDYDTLSVDVSEINAPYTKVKATPLNKGTEATAKEINNNSDLILWLFYAIVFIVYFSWVFAPSKNGTRDKDLVKKKIIASITLKKDESGLQAWNPNWKPEEEKESEK